MVIVASSLFLPANNPGPRRGISDDGLELYIDDLCKDCLHTKDHLTDLMNVQCEARNIHNYTFADAYLNVLRKYIFAS